MARSAFVARKVPSIFSRFAGSAQRAFVASLILARVVGLRIAARHLAPATGSAHRALAAALRFSRVSDVVRGRGRLISFGLRKGKPAKEFNQPVHVSSNAIN